MESRPIFYSERLKLKSRVGLLPKSPNEGMGRGAGVEALPGMLNGIPHWGVGTKISKAPGMRFLREGTWISSSTVPV